jgi:hypothetical protein
MVAVMIEILSFITYDKLESADLFFVLDSLSKSGWRPAILESRRTLLDLAGVPKNEPIVEEISRDYLRRRPMAAERYGGDIFFKDDDVFYLMTYETGSWGTPWTILENPVHEVKTDQPRIEIGIVSKNNPSLRDRLEAFAEAVKRAALDTLDGRKTRHLKFHWTKLRDTDEPYKIKRIFAENKESTESEIAPCQLDDSESHAVSLLTDKELRTLLIDLSQVGFAREKDIFAHRGKNQEGIRLALQKLQEATLIDTVYLLSCKSTSRPLTKLLDRSALSSPDIGALKCPSCNSRFSDETVSEGFSLSDLGRRLIRKSHWMTIWITLLLQRLGVPSQSIFRNIVDANEEVDIIVEYMDRVWIFELKDREFSAGDAYPLNYRQMRYRADKSIIVTTDKVSRDARRVFEDVVKESDGRRSLPTCIEGLEQAESVLQDELSKTELSFAADRIGFIGMLTGYNLTPILARKFGVAIDASSIRTRYYLM